MNNKSIKHSVIELKKSSKEFSKKKKSNHIRIRPDAYSYLKKLSRERKKSITEVCTRIINNYKKLNK